jgi:maltose/moltooligosaccharide transporter
MGIFNFFIVIPEILAALVFGKIMETVLTNDSAIVRVFGGDNRLSAVVIGGISMAIAAALVTIVKDDTSEAGVTSTRADEKDAEKAA